MPGHWQLQGWSHPQYTNIPYPFHVDPPNVPFDNNQCGSYIRKFVIPQDFINQQLRLRFEGVDSAFHVYLNGKEVGYSQGARNPAEFDITSEVNKDQREHLGCKSVSILRWQLPRGPRPVAIQWHLSRRTSPRVSEEPYRRFSPTDETRRRLPGCQARAQSRNTWDRHRHRKAPRQRRESGSGGYGRGDGRPLSSSASMSTLLRNGLQSRHTCTSWY